MRIEGGDALAMTFEVADVTMPLASAGRIIGLSQIGGQARDNLRMCPTRRWRGRLKTRKPCRYVGMLRCGLPKITKFRVRRVPGLAWRGPPHRATLPAGLEIAAAPGAVGSRNRGDRRAHSGPSRLTHTHTHHANTRSGTSSVRFLGMQAEPCQNAGQIVYHMCFSKSASHGP